MTEIIKEREQFNWRRAMVVCSDVIYEKRAVVGKEYMTLKKSYPLKYAAKADLS